MTKTANYLFVEKDGNIYTLHMTPELQDDVGTIGYVEFTETESVEKNNPFITLEASKTVLEVRSPLQGKIVERNEAAEDDPKLLNSEKDEENWLVKLEGVDEKEFNNLEDA